MAVLDEDMHEKIDRLVKKIYVAVKLKCSPMNITMKVSHQNLCYIINNNKVSVKIIALKI